MNTTGRPTRPAAPSGDVSAASAWPDCPSFNCPSFTEHRGLQQEEPLLFELDQPGTGGTDWPEVEADFAPRLGSLTPRESVGLPSLSEPRVVRHYTRLSQKNYAIDTGIYPLGSCTMKHNPRLHEKLARLPGFADLHPFQPFQTVQGALEVMQKLAHWLTTLTGMSAVTLSPAAGAHGELCGMLALKAALEDTARRQEEQSGTPVARRVVLVPESAHGTNPATAASVGFEVVPLKAGADGRLRAADVRAHLGPHVAALMITNPNTCGLFEREIVQISEAVHEAGGYVYCDGANFNALIGRVRPGDLGVDCMHLNLHKTFSTPHGGGGPGAGPVVFSHRLSPYVPLPHLLYREGALHLVEDPPGPGGVGVGRLKAFHGQFGLLVRALAYCLSHGADGFRQISGDAVLNANYLLARLKDVMSAPYPAPCMHEALFDDTFLKGTEITTLDIAKAMIDAGVHPMTMYFPLVVHGAFLIEPTESENRDSLDALITVLETLARRAREADPTETHTFFQSAPRHTPRRRLDETRAARHPVLRWRAGPPSEDTPSPVSHDL